MIGKERCKQIVGHGLIDAATGFLSAKQEHDLWQIFVQIVDTWHDGTYVENVPENYYGQWHEFVVLNIQQVPSYINEYLSGLTVLAELKNAYPKDYWYKLLFENKLNIYFDPRKNREFDFPDRATRLGHFKLYVIDEFIDVFLTCGGYRQFKKSGLGNYNTFIYQSRYN